ncbi:hypothetical protein CEXT_269061 [Caerostris extrusa]|uniref:Uncharacterized protein n=1 Tax=Caerostris extrusa TaxID=172846 RepID=A0AAV4R273_CAEEX|nr:hypothetical protein CEXT_269061 [Caerostris extrusa]
MFTKIIPSKCISTFFPTFKKHDRLEGHSGIKSNIHHPATERLVALLNGIPPIENSFPSFIRPSQNGVFYRFQCDSLSFVLLPHEHATNLSGFLLFPEFPHLFSPAEHSAEFPGKTGTGKTKDYLIEKWSEKELQPIFFFYSGSLVDNALMPTF